MRAIYINPFDCSVTAIVGDLDALIERELPGLTGMVDLAPGVGLICSPIGSIGSQARLFWHSGLREYFGGKAYVIGVDETGKAVAVPDGWWLRTFRSIKFLGSGDEALPLLEQLIGLTMDAPAESTG